MAELSKQVEQRETALQQAAEKLNKQGTLRGIPRLFRVHIVL
jgi:predicted transposase YdaD